MTNGTVVMGYQDSFRTSVRSRTEQLLELMGIPARLEQVMLVATPAPGIAGATHVVPGSGTAARLPLDQLGALAARMYAEHDLRAPEHGDRGFDQQRQDSIRRDCVSSALAELIRQTAEAGSPVVTQAVRRGDREFVVGLVLPQRVFEAAPMLEEHHWGPRPASRSLLDAALLELCLVVAYDLGRPEPGPRDVSVSAAELRDRAVDRFFGEALWRAGTHLHLPRRAMDRLSSSTYENAAAVGHLLFASTAHPAVTATTPFARSVPARRTRQVRKLLETTGSGHALLVADGEAHAFGWYDTHAVTDPDDDVLEVAVTGHARWELRRQGTVLMVVDHGAGRIPRQSFEEVRLRDMAVRLLGDDAEVDRLVDLVGAAASLGHGSTLVVTRNAVAEAERLGTQGVGVEPHDLTPERFQNLAHIDGAFLLDERLVLHAFGVILDGTADDAPGDPARGSRYNSAVRYVTTRDADGVIAIVTSDDGGVDLTPDLKPRLPRELVEDTVIRLQEAAGDPARRRDFIEAEEDLRDLQDHLDEQQGRRANKALLVERSLRREEGIAEVAWTPFDVSPPLPEEFFL